MGHVAAALKISHQWCVFLTPKNTKNIQRMTDHCFLRAIRRPYELQAAPALPRKMAAR